MSGATMASAASKMASEAEEMVDEVKQETPVLSEDLLEHLFSFLPLDDLFPISRLNKRFQHIYQPRIFQLVQSLPWSISVERDLSSIGLVRVKVGWFKDEDFIESQEKYSQVTVSTGVGGQILKSLTSLQGASFAVKIGFSLKSDEWLPEQILPLEKGKADKWCFQSELEMEFLSKPWDYDLVNVNKNRRKIRTIEKNKDSKSALYEYKRPRRF